MPLTTVSEGRVYDWSHAVGRNAARGPGFNYVQTMCLGKNGVLYAANRGNENNFGMHVNKVQLGGPGEEEAHRRFLRIRRGRRSVHLAVRGCGRRQRPCLRVGRLEEHDLRVRQQRQIPAEVGRDRQRRRSSCFARPAWP